MKGLWWKIISVLLILYSVIAGFLIPVPDIGNLHETIRNIFFHVCMWFAMIVMLTASAVNSTRFLLSGKLKHDVLAKESVNIAILFGIPGIITGVLWAKYAWGQWWMNDSKLNGVAVGLVAYFAYVILRSAVPDELKRARISAVYNILSFVVFVLFILILPKLSTGSIHPGDGAGAAMPLFTLDENIRFVFYPAVIGWILFAAWILDVKVRIHKLSNQK